MRRCGPEDSTKACVHDATMNNYELTQKNIEVAAERRSSWKSAVVVDLFALLLVVFS